MKKRISMIIAIVVVLSIFLGCAANQTGTETTKASDSASATTVAAGEKKLITDTPVEISLAMPEMSVAGASYADNLPVFQEIERRTGVKIKWETINPDDYTTVMRTRVAAATDLPDIFSLSGIDILPLIKGNLLLQLDDYIEKYGPNIKALYENGPDIKAMMVSPEGKMYCLPNRVISIRKFEVNPQSFIIRNDWLEKVNASMPETIDDWYNVLTLFATKDPNGNNQKDEIPFSGQDYNIEAFAEAYGIHYSTPFYPDANGVVQYDWMQPSAKDFFLTMNKWYKEKLIDPQYLSITSDMMWGQMLDDLVGSTFQAAASNCDWLNQNNTKDPNVDWLAVAPPKNVNGGDGFVLIDDRSGGKSVISASCKNPEIAVKWVDYLFSDEGSTLTSMGIEGIHCERKDGQLVYKAELSADGKWYENSKKAGIDPSGVPQILRKEFYDDMLKRYSDRINASVAPIAKYLATPFPSYIASDDEAEVLNKKLADIETYSQEMRHKFIVGSEDISNFDKYVQKLKELGIEDVIKVYQAQYNRGVGK